MAYKPLWDWMDKHEGRESSSFKAMEHEKKRQGYSEPKEKKKAIAKKMESKTYTHVRCGKCNRFGHSHEKCTTKSKPKDNYMFESTAKTIKRIKNNPYDSRYDD